MIYMQSARRETVECDGGPERGSGREREMKVPAR